MRFFVAGAMYRASGALFNTIETVAGENPLCVATSLIVTAWFFSLGRFTRMAPLVAYIITLALSRLQCSLLLRRRLKRKWPPEPIRLPNAERNSRDHPDGSQDLRRTAEAEPQSEANNETKHRRNKIPRFLLLCMQKITDKRRGVHAHKR